MPTETEVEVFRQRARDAQLEVTAAIISDSRPQCIARGFNQFVRSCGM